LIATNSANDTLELGDDCNYHLAAKEARSLQPRAALSTDCLYTSTSIPTYTVHTITTITSTVTRQEVTETFSCPAMSVTNSVGDELSLNEEYQLEFSPGNSAASTTNVLRTASGSALTSGSSKGRAGDVASLVASRAFICLSLLTLLSTCVSWC